MLGVRHARLMPGVTIDIDPSEAGFTAERLSHIDHHFQEYIDDGRLAGVVTKPGLLRAATGVR